MVVNRQGFKVFTSRGEENDVRKVQMQWKRFMAPSSEVMVLGPVTVTRFIKNGFAFIAVMIYIWESEAGNIKVLEQDIMVWGGSSALGLRGKGAKDSHSVSNPHSQPLALLCCTCVHTPSTASE
jgi:hypothetical protein